LSKREKGPSSFWLKLISVILMVLALTGLLGSLGFSIGKLVYNMFTGAMGSWSLAGPFICLGAGILLWILSPNLTSFFMSLSSSGPKSRTNSRLQGNRRSEQHISNQMHGSKEKADTSTKGLPLPAGKLVSLKGFDQYFSSPEMVDMKDSDLQTAEEMKEIGKDFPTYFGTGKSFYSRKSGKMTTLKGLKNYIEEVDKEERIERELPWKTNPPREIKETLIEKPLIDKPHTEKPAQASVFKSQADQIAYLAQFKDDVTPLDLGELDLLEPLSEDFSPINVSKKLDHVVECSVFEDKLVMDLEVESETFDMKEETNESELVNDLRAVLLDTACASLEIHLPEEAEVPEVPVLSLKPSHVVFVPQLNDVTLNTVNHWRLPEYDLLEPVIKRVIIHDTETSNLLEKVLLDFGVKAKVIRVTRGPVITRYELAPAPGVKISKIVNLSDDIALGLAARDVRIEAPIPGKAAIGIEVPNKHARSVPFREVLETTSFGEYPSKLKVALGKDIADQPIIGDLIKMPHLLVAGATGSGKSVCITSIINSILYNATPDEVKLLLVDPKMVELSQYNGIPHLLAPVVVDPKKAASALKWIVKEMENRYELFAAAGVRDIERYNKMKAGETEGRKPALPFIVVVIDELADLMMVAAGEVEEAICRLAQMARAAGIHLVIATQRPSVDVITGVIKANIPSRISFAVSSQIDSRTILDAAGAEKLLGRGDMLYSPLGVNKALRVQGCLVTDDEVQRVITHWKGLGRPEYLDPEHLFAETTLKNEESNGPDDVLFIDAGQLFIRTGIASVSFLQRKLKLGYTRAARLMDMLQEQGVVGAYEGSKPRQVLLTLDEFNERFG